MAWLRGHGDSVKELLGNGFVGCNSGKSCFVLTGNIKTTSEEWQLGQNQEGVFFCSTLFGTSV